MEFMSLSRRRSSSRNFPSGEEGGGTAVFVGYYGPLPLIIGAVRIILVFMTSCLFFFKSAPFVKYNVSTTTNT